MLIKIICSWCGCSLGCKECQDTDFPGIEEPITHSICPECKEKALAEIEVITIEELKPNR